MDFELEICVNSIHSALAAQLGGASRIELCDNMAEGGTTPSAGMIIQCKKLLSIPIFPIIRPRGGDFLYSDQEFELMKQDIIFAKKAGCEGVVIGILKANGNVDSGRCAELIDLALPMQVTFHRAFDRCNNLKQGLEDIIALGCQRVLTSGGKVSAADSHEILAMLVNQAGSRVAIMAGSGVTEDNVALLAEKTGVRQFHSTAKVTSISAMTYKASGELADQDGDFSVMETSMVKVQNMRQSLSAVFSKKSDIS